MRGWPGVTERGGEDCPGVPGTSEMLTRGLVLLEAAEKPILLICFADASSTSSWAKPQPAAAGCHRIEWGGGGVQGATLLSALPVSLCRLPDCVPGPVLGAHTQELT